MTVLGWAFGWRVGWAFFNALQRDGVRRCWVVAIPRDQLQRYALLSIAAAVVVVSLKGVAFWLTGSVGLLSDALESLVNVAAAVATWLAVSLAARPPDEDHAFGHDKIEFFASGFEGALILTAALGIFWAALPRLLAPLPMEAAGLGLAVSATASVINLWVAMTLLRAGKKHHSMALSADGRHLLTDVWTSVGVLTGLVLTAVTGWNVLDPMIALLVGCYVVWIGGRLIWEAVHALLDKALPTDQMDAVNEVLARYASEQVQFHALRTRWAGARQFVSFHVLVPDAWTVRRGHDLLEEIEADLRAVLPSGIIFTHLEPIDDPASWDDEHLDRLEG